VASVRDTLLKPLLVGRERVAVPEFGDDEFVWCYGMTAREKNAHDANIMKKDWSGVDRGRALVQKQRMIVRCVKSDTGERIFSDEDVAALGEWPADLLNRVFDVCNKLSGGDTDSIGADAVKNSEEITDD